MTYHLGVRAQVLAIILVWSGHHSLLFLPHNTLHLLHICSTTLVPLLVLEHVRHAPTLGSLYLLFSKYYFLPNLFSCSNITKYLKPFPDYLLQNNKHHRHQPLAPPHFFCCLFFSMTVAWHVVCTFHYCVTLFTPLACELSEAEFSLSLCPQNLENLLIVKLNSKAVGDSVNKLMCLSRTVRGFVS